MRYYAADTAKESWSHLALRDSLAFVQFFVVRWLGLLGAWNSLIAPATDLPEITPVTAACLVAGWVFGFILKGM
jgi:hypothetical protein